MTQNELDAMLRVLVEREVFAQLQLISGKVEPYTANGANGSGPIQFITPRFEVEIDVKVRNA